MIHCPIFNFQGSIIEKKKKKKRIKLLDQVTNKEKSEKMYVQICTRLLILKVTVAMKNKMYQEFIRYFLETKYLENQQKPSEEYKKQCPANLNNNIKTSP